VFAYVRINSWADKNLFLSLLSHPDLPNYYSTIYLLFRFIRRANANNPIRDATIPNPGAFGVAVAETVVTAVGVAVGVNVAVDVRVGVGGAPITLRAALALAAWLVWFSNNVP